MYKVVLADNETWVAIRLRKLIEKSKLPFQIVAEAGNGIQALEEVIDKKPDILITAIRMPGMDGLELLEMVRRAGLDVKVIFFSGYAEFEYARRAIRMGAFDYLLKPVELNVLAETLGRARREIESKQEANDERTSTISRIVREIQEKYTGNLTLTGLAEKYNISASHLSGQLKEELGMPFSEYIADRRVRLAKELLADERLSINEIAERVGYNDYFYFIKVFKKVTGISPSKYRKVL